MDCATCKNGQTRPGLARVTLERNERIITIKNVPAEICEDCGEYHLTSEISAGFLRRAEAAASRVPKSKKYILRERK